MAVRLYSPWGVYRQHLDSPGGGKGAIQLRPFNRWPVIYNPPPGLCKVYHGMSESANGIALGDSYANPRHDYPMTHNRTLLSSFV